MVNTHIQVDEEVWEFLKQKKGIGESFNDILRRELKIKSKEKKKWMKVKNI